MVHNILHIYFIFIYLYPRRERDSATGFPNYYRPVIVDFYEGGKLEHPEKNPRSQIEIDKSQPTFMRVRVVEVGDATLTRLPETTKYRRNKKNC